MLCKCGCGNPTKPGNNFIKGHNGRCRSEEALNRIGEATKARWKDPDFRRKMRSIHCKSSRAVGKTVKQLWASTQYRDDMMRIRAEKRSYEKVSASLKRNWRDPVYIMNHVGPKASAWKGGKSFESYCPVWDDRDFKESIKERDNYMCQNPACLGGKKSLLLVIHHIDYDKKHCNPSNLIVLCRSCNGGANGGRLNRSMWESFYSSIMARRGLVYVDPHSYD